ncbi:MAG: NgoPII family restriction endonuclease [Marinifilaceae bacterium]|jgi:hypothetical protein|nr:NgoPII family restriction endonuclease [Marinifilaceae bacterium]
MTNILEAIINISKCDNFNIKEISESKNRANSMGEALEKFIKDSFAGTIDVEDENERNLKYSSEFSWLGSQNNPPDIMIKGGDAIEVKKTQSANSSLALNSSYPKHKLESSNPMVTKDCSECEDWTEKDLIYAVGHTTDNELKSLWLYYGEIYAAKDEIYTRIKNTISTGIREIPNVVFSETKELGRVNRVDPLGITNLRIRGMWQIENPRKVFDYIFESSNSNIFELVSIIPSYKYYSFCKETIEIIEADEAISISEVKVKNPNNPAKLIDCKLITFTKKR